LISACAPHTSSAHNIKVYFAFFFCVPALHDQHIMHSTVRVLGDGLPREVGGVEEAIAIEFGVKQLQLSLVWDDGDAQLAPLFSGSVK
jgi:hypothetical protein